VFPNPFGQSVNIRFRPQRETKYRIKAYDVSGRLVKKIYDGLMIDNRTLCWNGDDVAGRTVPQGIYFLTIENLVSGKVMCEKILKIE
jgi:flagellar hook assembly protein FlgD